MFCNSKKNIPIETIFQKISDIEVNLKKNNQLFIQNNTFQNTLYQSIIADITILLNNSQNNYLREISELKNQITFIQNDLLNENNKLKNDISQISFELNELKLCKEKVDCEVQVTEEIQIIEEMSNENKIEEEIPQKKKRTYNRKKEVKA